MRTVSDTTLSARREQLDILRRLGGPRRLLMAMEMSDEVRAVTEAGIRHRHPDWSDEDVRSALVKLLIRAEPVEAMPELARAK